MNDRTKLEEDNTFKRDSELNNTPAKDEFNEFTYLINRSKAALESYTQLEKYLISWNRYWRIPIDNSRKSNVSYGLQLHEVILEWWRLGWKAPSGIIQYGSCILNLDVSDRSQLALQAIVGIEVEIIQQNLSKVYVDRYDEGMRH